MRLFVAVEIEPTLATAAGALIKTLRIRAQHLAPHARISWVPEDRLHLTVRFIGHAGEAAATAIQRALDPPLALAPFSLSLAGPGAFPLSGRPKVVWVGIADGGARLEELEREVTGRLAKAGVPVEDRPYRPHLTLARVREAAGLRPSRLFEGVEATSLGTTRVEAITLFESRLASHGPEYVPVLRTPLERAGLPR